MAVNFISKLSSSCISDSCTCRNWSVENTVKNDSWWGSLSPASLVLCLFGSMNIQPFIPDAKAAVSVCATQVRWIHNYFHISSEKLTHCCHLQPVPYPLLWELSLENTYKMKRAFIFKFLISSFYFDLFCLLGKTCLEKASPFKKENL